MLQLIKLKKIGVKAYDSARPYKERVKLFYGRRIRTKQFTLGMKALLYDSKLYLFQKKLRFYWTNPYVLSHVVPCGSVTI